MNNELKKEFINKACEWLEDQTRSSKIIIESFLTGRKFKFTPKEFINNFREAMEKL